MPIISGELDLEQFLTNLPKMPKQHQFLTSTAPNLALVGGVGCGKTVGLCATAIIRAELEKDGLSLIARLNVPALETSTMRTFLEMVPDGRGEWMPTRKTYRFHNGHEVIFRHLDISDPKVVGHIRSMNLSHVYVDEGSEINQEIFFLLLSRLRRRTAPQNFFRMTSNPAGHDWMWKYFFNPDRERKWKERNLGITMTTFENPFLPQEFLDNQTALYPPDWAERFLYGHFSDFSDLVYKEWSEDIHVWDATKGHAFFQGSDSPPPEWPVIVGMDIGSDIDPWAIVLVAVAPDGRLFQFEEVYGNSLLIRSIAEELHLKLGSRELDGLAYDYANRQAALELAEYDIQGTAAIKEVRPGLFKTAQYVHVDPRMPHPFNSKIKGSPRYFVSSVCENTRREIAAYKWAKDRSNEWKGEPSHENSHSPDAIRYAIHTFRPLPEKLTVPKAWENPNLDEASRLYWKDADKYPDKHEALAHFHAQGPAKTWQDWTKIAQRAPKRFQKPWRRVLCDPRKPKNLLTRTIN